MAVRRAPTIWMAVGGLVLALIYGWTRSGVDLAGVGVGVGVGDTVEQLHEARRSGVVVEGRGVVERVLPDDLEGSKHQRFVLRLDSGHTLLVSHNVDLAPRVARIAPGDEVDFRGQYEWNARGGLVHWTHRDPQRGRPGGWLRHQGRTYR